MKYSILVNNPGEKKNTENQTKKKRNDKTGTKDLEAASFSVMEQF